MRMSSWLGEVSFASLIPDSIRGDKTVAAAAEAMDGLLRRTTHAIPNLLIWARLDRESERLIPPLARLVRAAGGVKALPTELLELLAWQLHVDFREIALNDSMLERMVRESIPWHRIKGTPAAVVQALAMYNIAAKTDESGTGRNWAVYELELEDVPRGGTLANIVRVAEEAAPKRCQLRRVYGKFDRRPIILDRGPALDDGYLDDDSGVWDPETGVKQSFGETTGLQSDPYSMGVSAICAEHMRSGRIYYLDRPILDQWKLDDPTVRCHGFVGGAVVSLQSIGIEGNKYTWSSRWNERKWNECGGYPGSAPIHRRRIDFHRSVSKSQMVLDSGRLDSSFERLDRQRVLLVDTPSRLDISRLDAGSESLNRRTVFIDERLQNVSRTEASQREAEAAGAAVFSHQAFTAERAEASPGIAVTTYHEEILALLALRRLFSTPCGGEWTGAWDARPWRSQVAPMHITTEGE